MVHLLHHHAFWEFMYLALLKRIRVELIHINNKIKLYLLVFEQTIFLFIKLFE